MAYKKNVWKSKDRITKEKLNNIEKGIYEAHKNIDNYQSTPLDELDKIKATRTAAIEAQIREKKIKFNKKNAKEKPLDEIICEKENELFQNYLKTKKNYNLQTLKCIMEHYRNLVKPKVVSDNFWSIIAIIVSILLAFVTKDGFDFNSFEKALPYLISIGFVVLIILFFIRQFSQAKVFFKGEDGMYERLEEIFSELYIKYISDIEVSNLNTSKKKIGKNVKKEQPEGIPKRRRNSNKSLK